MKSFLLISILMLGQPSAFASEAAQINKLQAQCGDDILCYFSQEEVSAALGDNAQELAQSGMLEIDNNDPYAHEDGEHLSEGAKELLQTTDFSARSRSKVTAKSKGKSKVKGKSKRARRGGGGVNTNLSAHTGAPIWGSFISNFRKCAPGCVPANIGTYGERGNYTCHATGQAVDVGAIVCGGTPHKAINNGRFTKFVGCMKRKMKVLWHNGRGITKGHYDHAHMSNGCTVADGTRWI